MTISTAREARAEGQSRGRAAGSWMLDGNSTKEYAARLIKGHEEGDPEIMDLQPDPLSGEWAEESIPEIFGSHEALSQGELLEAFEQSFQEAFWDEVIESAMLMVDEDAGSVQ